MGVIFESILMELCIILLASITYVYIYFQRSFIYWSNRDVVQLPARFPLGNINCTFLKYTGQTVARIYKELRRTGAKYGGFYILTSPVFMPLHPDVWKAILLKDFNTFSDRGFYYNEDLDPMTSNIATVQGDKWYYLRSKFTPAFTSSKIKFMCPTVVRCAEEIRNVLEELTRRCNPMDVKDITGRYTTDVIGSCAFGFDCNSLRDPDSEFRKNLLLFIDSDLWSVIKIIVGTTMPNILKLFNTTLFNSKATSYMYNLVRTIIEERENCQTEREDLMDLLIRLKRNEDIDEQPTSGSSMSDKYNEPLTLNDIAAQVLLFSFAGYDTSSSTITFCLYELAVNLEIQEKLHREINEVLAKHNGCLNYNVIMEMSYLDKVIRETLRKYPAGLFLNRRCNQNYKLPESDLVLEKDTKVIISTLGIHFDPEYYPDPDTFDPERFSEVEIEKRPKYTYLPFGDGLRNCIGMRFGLLETKIGVAAFLNGYKFTLNPKTQLPLDIMSKSIMITTKNKIWLDIHKL